MSFVVKIKFSVSRMYKQSKKTKTLTEAAKQLFHLSWMSALIDEYSLFIVVITYWTKPLFHRISSFCIFLNFDLFAQVWEEMVFISWIFSKFKTEMYKAAP